MQIKNHYTKMPHRYRNCIGTLFTESNEHERVEGESKIKYFIGQYEEGESGKRHLQFYCEFTTKVSLKFIKKLFGRSVHVEPRRGSQREAIDYCSKEDTRVEGPFEFGIKAEPGKRTDLERLKKDLDEGISLQDISQNHFRSFLLYNRGIKEYRLLNTTKRTWEMENSILWGRAGTGKTRLAYDLAERDCVDVYPLMRNSSGKVWFDGYVGQEILLIDDYYGWIPLSFLFQLMDRYPMFVQTKGSSVPFVSKKIIITSNKAPEDWYNWHKFGKDMQEAFVRRITNCFYYKAKDEIEEHEINFKEPINAVEFDWGNNKN